MVTRVAKDFYFSNERVQLFFIFHEILSRNLSYFILLNRNSKFFPCIQLTRTHRPRLEERSVAALNLPPFYLHFENFHLSFAIPLLSPFYLWLEFGMRVQIQTHDWSVQHELRCASGEQVFLDGSVGHRIAFVYHATPVASQMPVRFKREAA